MLILPAIDIRGGKVVRLLHGDFSAETEYGDDPAAQARAFAEAGAAWVHVVDLDGAKAGAVRQTRALAAVAGAGAKVQAGGGVRSIEDIDALLKAGVSRVVIGSMAVSQPPRVRVWLGKYGPEKLTVALDVRIERGTPMAVVTGWQETTDVSLWTALDLLGNGVRHLLVTDVGRDGALGGPNLALIAEVARRRPDIAVQASGGVRDRADLDALAGAGAAAAIVGRALYEGTLTLEDALAC